MNYSPIFSPLTIPFRTTFRKVTAAISLKKLNKNVDCKNLISRMLHVDITTRATLDEIVQHPWFDSKLNITNYEVSRDINEDVLESLVSLGYDRNEVIHAVKNNKYVDAAATYFLMLSKRKRTDNDVVVAASAKSPIAALVTPIKKATPTHKR